MYLPDIDRIKLIERLQFTMKKKDVLQLAESFSLSGFEIEEIISLTSHSNQTLGFHSAWVLENMLLPMPEALDYYLLVIIEQLPHTTNPSVKRHFAKLVSFGINRIVKRQTAKVFEKEFWQTNLEPLEEVCFKWLVEENTKPAVKAHCMDILFLLSYRQKWIAEELPHIIENQMEMGPPSIRAKGKEILKSIKKRSKQFGGQTYTIK
jgi:hypothetical protein